MLQGFAPEAGAPWGCTAAAALGAGLRVPPQQGPAGDSAGVPGERGPWHLICVH